jgi:pyridoxamine 5'-phosphate oxidase
MSIQEMRKTYSLAGLRTIDASSDPLVQFLRWFEESQQPDLPDWMEINAMTLSTADTTGHVSSRVVLLKGLEQGKLFFYTNYDSAKARQMTANPQVSLSFFWPHLQRQVRIEGTVTKTDRSQSERYFQNRPRDSQLGAHVSQQSTVIESRDVLEQGMQELEAKHANQTVPCPDSWGGYQVEPNRFEFWQGRESRLHDRVCYHLEGEHWKLTRLAP